MAPGGESGWRASSPRREGAPPGAVPTDPTDLLPAHRGVGAGARSSRRPRHPRAEPSERAHRPGVPAVFHPAARVAAREGAAVPHAGDWVVLPGPTPIRIVPAGLYYRAKRTFRSAALLHFGEPFAVEPVELAPGEEPPAGPVRALTARIEQALGGVTLQAGHVEALALVARAERIVSTQDDAPSNPPTLEQEFILRRRLIAGYEIAREQQPERFAALAARIDRYEAALAAAGLDPRRLAPRSFTLARVARYVAKAGMVLLLLLPAGVVGAAVHYPAYRVVGF